jgi:hypothetical protein
MGSTKQRLLNDASMRRLGLLGVLVAALLLGPSIGLGSNARAFAEPPPSPTTKEISSFDVAPSPGESSSIQEESSSILDHVRTPTEPPAFDPNTPPAKLPPLPPARVAAPVRAPRSSPEESSEDPTPAPPPTPTAERIASPPPVVPAASPPPEAAASPSAEPSSSRFDLDTEGDLPAPPVAPAPAPADAPGPDDTLPME